MYMLVLPMLLLDITWVQLLIGFLTLRLTAGLIVGIIFQLAHVVEENDHPQPNEENMIDEHWMIHEMITTNNFARGNKALCWVVCGLNFQIEHHLFTKVRSVHYPVICPIVEKTARESNIPYNHHDIFFEAVASHYRTLKKFGGPNFIYSETANAPVSFSGTNYPPLRGECGFSREWVYIIPTQLLGEKGCE